MNSSPVSSSSVPFACGFTPVSPVSASDSSVSKVACPIIHAAKQYRKRLEDVYGAKLVQEYLSECFSSYSKAIEAEDQLIFKTLDLLLGRVVFAQEASRRALAYLDPQDMLSTHQLIPDWVLEIVKYRINLDHSIQKLKKLDLENRHEMEETAKIRAELKKIYYELPRISHPVEGLEITEDLPTCYGTGTLWDPVEAFYVRALENETVWAVLDLRKVAAEDRANIVKWFSEQKMQEAFQLKKAFGAVTYYNLVEGKPSVAEKKGVIELFYEEATAVQKLYDTQNGKKKVRLMTQSNGDVARQEKPLDGIHFKGNWWGFDQGGLDRQRTAGVDRCETILACRSRMRQILEKGLEALTLNDISNFRAYYMGICSADIAKLPGSYASDPVLHQATNHIGNIEETLQFALQTKKAKDVLESGLEVIRKGKGKVEGILARTQQFRSMLETWVKECEDFNTLVDTSQSSELQQISRQIKNVHQETLNFLEKIASFIPLIEASQEKESQLKAIQEFLQEFLKFFKSLKLVFNELQLIRVNGMVYETYLEYATKIGVNPHKTPIATCFQGPSRLVMSISEIIDQCAGLDKVHGKSFLEFSLQVDECMNEIERFRSVGEKQLLALPKEVLLKRFFPTYRRPLSERLNEAVLGAIASFIPK